MPAFAIQYNNPVALKIGIGLSQFRNLRLDLFQGARFCLASVRVESMEFLGERLGLCRISREKELDDVGCRVHAASGVDPWRNAKGDVPRVEALDHRTVFQFKTRELHQGSKSSLIGTSKLLQPQSHDRPILSVERD